MADLDLSIEDPYLTQGFETKVFLLLLFCTSDNHSRLIIFFLKIAHLTILICSSIKKEKNLF